MLRRVINPFLLLPFALSITTMNVLSSETKNYIDNVLEEKSNITFVDYQEIEKLVLNCLLYTSQSPRDSIASSMPSSA